MALEIKKYEKLLLMMVIGIPIIASTNIDCNGKSFHCVNSTHFMICVDLGGGVSTTVDNFVIPCPPPTKCKKTNYFECEIPISSTLAPTGQPFMAPLENMANTLEWEQISTTSRNTDAEQHLELSTVQPITVVTESSLVSNAVTNHEDPITILENFTMENITESIIWQHGLSVTDSAINEVIIGNTTTAVENVTTWENLVNNYTTTFSIIEIVTGQTTINFTELITDATEPSNSKSKYFYTTREPVWNINGNEGVTELNDSGNFLLNESNKKNKAESVDIASITTIEHDNLQTNKIPVAATEKSQNNKVGNVTVNLENVFKTTTVTSLYDGNQSLDETNTLNTTELDSKVITNNIITGTDFKTISEFPIEVVTKVVTSTASSDSNKIANFNTTKQTITTKTVTSNLYVSETSSPILTSVNVNNTTKPTYDNEDPMYENMKFQDIPKLQSLNESSDITLMYVTEGNNERYPISILNKIDLNNTYISTTANITENKMNTNETGKDTFLFLNETELTTVYTAENFINPVYDDSIKIPQVSLFVTNNTSYVSNFEVKEKDSKVVHENNPSTLDSKVTIENTSKSVDGSKTEANNNVMNENITEPSNLYVNRTGMFAMNSINDSTNFNPQKEDSTFILHVKEDHITSLGQDVTTDSWFDGSKLLFDDSKLTIINNITIPHNDKVIKSNNTISSIYSVSSSQTENKTVFQGLNQQTLFKADNSLNHGLTATEAYNETKTPKLNNDERVAVDNYFTTTTNKILTESSKAYVDTFTYRDNNIVKISTKNDAELSHAKLYTTLPTVSASATNYEKVLTDQKNTVDINTEILPPFTTFKTLYENITITTPPMLPIQENNIESEVVTEVYSSKNIDTKESNATTKFTSIVDSVINTETIIAAVSTASLSSSFDINTTKQTDIATTSEVLSLYSKINDETAQNVITTESTLSLKALTIPQTAKSQIMQINESNIMIEDSVQYPIYGNEMHLELTTAKSSKNNFGDLTNMTSDTQINKDITINNLKSSMEPVSMLQSRTEATVSSNKATGTTIKNKEEFNITITPSEEIGIQKFSVADNTDMNIIKNTDATEKYTEYFPGITKSMSSLFTSEDNHTIIELQKNKTVANKVTSTNDRTKINKLAIDLANPTNPFENLLLNNTIMPLASEQTLKGSTDIIQEPLPPPISSTSSNTYNITSVIREMLFNNGSTQFTDVTLRLPSTHDTTERGKILFEIIPSVGSSSVTANNSMNSLNSQNEYDIDRIRDIAIKNFTETIFSYTTNIAEEDEIHLPKSHSTTTETGKVLPNSLLSELSSVTKNPEIPINLINLDESNITKHIKNPSSVTENTLVNHGNVMVDKSTSIVQASYDKNTTTETADVLMNSLPSIEISLTTETYSTLKNKYQINATKGIVAIQLSTADTTLLNYSNVEVNKLDFPASHITTRNTSKVLSNKISPIELSFVTETNSILLNSSDKQNLYVNNRTSARKISDADEIAPVKDSNLEVNEPGSMLLASPNKAIKKGEELSNNTPLIESSFTTKGRNILNNSLNTQNEEANITRDGLIFKSSNGVDKTWLNHGMVNNSYYGLPVHLNESTATGEVFPNIEITSTSQVDSILKNTSDAQTAYEVNIPTNNATIEVDSRLPAIHYTFTLKEEMIGHNLIPVQLNFTTESNRILINSSKMQRSDNKVMTKSPVSGSDSTVSNFVGIYSYEDSVSPITHDVSTQKSIEVSSNDLSSVGIRSSATEANIIPRNPSNIIITLSSSADTSIIKPDNINNWLSTTISPNEPDIENITLLPFTKTTRPVVNGNYNKATNPFVITSTTTAYKGQEEFSTNDENPREHATDNKLSTDITQFILGQTEALSATLTSKELTTRKGMTPFYVTAAANPTTETTIKVSLETKTAPIQHSSPLPQNSPVESNPLQSLFNCKGRGRYSDKHDCRKFYICNGSPHVITGLCPFNTVFSEIKKLCTKNLSHCIRENQFHCVSAGRFSDFWLANVYYICVKNGDAFLRYKLQCQNGYYLNKTTVRCYQYPESSSLSFSYDNSQSTTERKVERKKMKKENKKEQFICEMEGKFPYSDDSKKYYVCSKRNRSHEFKVKVKKCDSDEIFHKKKRRCVDASSYERS